MSYQRRLRLYLDQVSENVTDAQKEIDRLDDRDAAFAMSKLLAAINALQAAIASLADPVVEEELDRFRSRFGGG